MIFTSLLPAGFY